MAWGHGWAWGGEEDPAGPPAPPSLSSHDVTAAALWLLTCHVRGRPLPCQPLAGCEAEAGGPAGCSGAHKGGRGAGGSSTGGQKSWGVHAPLMPELQERFFGITLDLRHNCPGACGGARARVRSGPNTHVRAFAAAAGPSLAASTTRVAAWPTAWCLRRQL